MLLPDVVIVCVLTSVVCDYGIVEAKMEWTPQFGTTKYPKCPELSPMAKKGDIYLLGSNLYRALLDMDFIQQPKRLVDIPEHGNGNEYWRSVPQGSYILPFIMGVDQRCQKGDIFYSPETHAYHRVTGKGAVHNFEEPEDCTWEAVDDTANWMSLSRSEIGDLRLGDLILPECHDAGTSGITENSILVDRNFLFQLAEELTPATVVNWSITQPDKFDLQMSSGFRSFDMRIADVDEFEPGVFRWWHGLAGDEITEGLRQVSDFCTEHQEEVLILDMNHFAAPGNSSQPTLPIPNARKDELSNILLQYLGDYMTSEANLSSNPTMNEVLSTGNNIIMVMHDDYIRAKDDRYWSTIIHSAWSGATNPEELFNERSSKLIDFKTNHPNSITGLSGCVTPNEQIILAGLLNVYGDNETIVDIINDTLPIILEVNPIDMSYEGLWMDLMSMARDGTNTVGMWARPTELYSNGASVHYRGTNDMLRHWVARPDLYKPNIVGTDDFLSSTFVETAISANLGEIPREVSIVHQGNPMNGYYVWDHDFATSGGDMGVNCTAIDVKYTIIDNDVVLEVDILEQIGSLDIPKGLYPSTAVCEIDVMSAGGSWFPLWSSDLEYMYNNTIDVYIRGSDLGDARGFAYVSTIYSDFGGNCTVPPVDNSNIIAFIQW